MSDDLTRPAEIQRRDGVHIFDNATANSDCYLHDWSRISDDVCLSGTVMEDSASATGSSVIFDSLLKEQCLVRDSHLHNSVITGHVGIVASTVNNAIVMGDALIIDSVIDFPYTAFKSLVITGKTVIKGAGIISGLGDFITMGPALSGRYTTAHNDRELGVRVNCGCFSGTVYEFQERIKITHEASTKAYRQYMAFLELVKEQFDLGELVAPVDEDDIPY